MATEVRPLCGDGESVMSGPPIGGALTSYLTWDIVLAQLLNSVFPFHRVGFDPMEGHRRYSVGSVSQVSRIRKGDPSTRAIRADWLF